MVEITTLSDQISVSGQIEPDQLCILAEQGVQVIVCNRPDGEAVGQPEYELIAAAAKKQGLEILNIPFAGGQMQPEQAQAFADLMSTGKRIHAYCRTGNRSSQLFAAANILLQSD